MFRNLKENEYFKWGLTLFCALTGAIIAYTLLSKVGYVWRFIVRVSTILTPIFIGVVFAYLLNPLTRYFEQHASVWMCGQLFQDGKDHSKFKRIFAIFLTYFIVALFIMFLLVFVVPKFLESVQLMISNVPVYINSVYAWAKGLLGNSPEAASNIDTINNNIMEYVKNIMVPSMDSITVYITSGISGFIRGTINTALGLIVSMYLLYDKESFLGGVDKIFKITLPKDIYDSTMTTLKFTDRVFGGFMMAKVIDSLIIAFLTFIILTIFGIPYALLISVIVGVTNIIPYFGPIIGAVPCAMLLLVIDPKKCLTFVILIFLIQQFDGNILGPKLIGNKTGIKSFWVLFSILLFGGLFGFVGMVFGVPVFAVIYSVISNSINKSLAKKKRK